MMRRILVGAAVMLTLLLVASPRAAEAQGLASLAAASGSSMAVDKTPTCYTCTPSASGYGLCTVAAGNGTEASWAKCTTAWVTGCNMSQPCSRTALLPVDLDGASQYVSRGSLLGVALALKDRNAEVKRNCQGVVVARFQTPGAIAQVRNSTGTLTL